MLVQKRLQTGLSFWGRSLLAEGRQESLPNSLPHTKLEETKTFLESLQAYTTTGQERQRAELLAAKLRALGIDPDQL